MANFTGPLQISAQSTLQSSATALATLGAYAETPDGRGFRYAKVGAVDLVAGNVIQAPAQLTNHQNMTTAAAAIGAVQVTVTPGATAGAANLYAGGFLFAEVTPGEGFTYRIKSHPAIVASTAFVVTLDPADALLVAFTSSTKTALIANPYSGVVQSPITTATNVAVGVAPCILSAAQFGWIQTHGPACTLITGTPAVGAMVVGTGAVAGAAAIASSTLGVIGRMMVTGVDAHLQGVWLTLD